MHVMVVPRLVKMNVEHEVSMLVEEIKRLGIQSKWYLCFCICELVNSAIHFGNYGDCKAKIALHL